MWSDYDKDRFYDQVKAAVISGATPEDLFEEIYTGYFLALDDMKRSGEYAFKQLKKGL